MSRFVPIPLVVALLFVGPACDGEGSGQQQVSEAQQPTPAATATRHEVLAEVPVEAYVSAAALRDEELPEGFFLNYAEYDDFQQSYRADFRGESRRIFTRATYFDTPKEAKDLFVAFATALEDQGYTVEPALEVDGITAVREATDEANLVSVVGLKDNLRIEVGLASAEDGVAQLQPLAESLMSGVVTRLDDLPAPGEKVLLPVDTPAFLEAFFVTAGHGRDLLRELKRRADGEPDDIPEAWVDVTVDCDVSRSADFFALWVLLSGSCNHYGQVRELIVEGSLGEAIETVARANELLDIEAERLP